MSKPRMIITVTLLVLLWIGIIGGIFYNTSRQTKMINLIGMTKKEVKEYAHEHNLNLKFEHDYSNQIDRGLVMRQNIYVSTILTEGDTLVITLSKGTVNKEAYLKHKVNELGKIPILMYHGISNVDNTAYKNGNVTKDGYERTVDAFKNDLEYFYQNNYQLISLNDYIGGKIDVDLGKSPLILTFDGGLENQIKVTSTDDFGNIVIDPKSAVGILESFKKDHPSFNVTATFFISKDLFHQKYNEKIIKWLIDKGYDIANNTYDYFNLDELNCFQSGMEIGRMYDELSNITNDYVKIVALPNGKPNELEHDNFKCILDNSYKKKNYKTVAALKDSGGLSYSPFDIKYTKLLNRIKAFDNNGDEDIKYYFKQLDSSRYISDGDINTIVVKKENLENVNNTFDLSIVSY